MDPLLKTWRWHYNRCIKRFHKAVGFFDNPNVPFKDKEEHWQAFRDLLMELSEAADAIQNDHGQTISPQEWEEGFK